MKIELKLSADALIALNDMLRKLYTLQADDKFQNVLLSIARDIADKTETKTRTLIKKSAVFSKKKQKLTIKYHEAWALEIIIRNQLKYIDNPYQLSLLQCLADHINQKLA